MLHASKAENHSRSDTLRRKLLTDHVIFNHCFSETHVPKNLNIDVRTLSEKCSSFFAIGPLKRKNCEK